MDPSGISSVSSGETFPGAGVTHAVQSDQRPGHSSSYAEAPSTRLHCRKYTRYRWWNAGETHLPCRLLEGNTKYYEIWDNLWFFCFLLFVHVLHWNEFPPGLSRPPYSRIRWSIWSWRQPCCRMTLEGTYQTVSRDWFDCRELDLKWLTWLWTLLGIKFQELVGTHS